MVKDFPGKKLESSRYPALISRRRAVSLHGAAAELHPWPGKHEGGKNRCCHVVVWHWLACSEMTAVPSVLRVGVHAAKNKRIIKKKKPHAFFYINVCKTNQNFTEGSCLIATLITRKKGGRGGGGARSSTWPSLFFFSTCVHLNKLHITTWNVPPKSAKHCSVWGAALISPRPHARTHASTSEHLCHHLTSTVIFTGWSNHCASCRNWRLFVTVTAIICKSPDPPPPSSLHAPTCDLFSNSIDRVALLAACWEFHLS